MELQSRARLLIADDHELVAEACKNLLEPEFKVVGIVNDGRALLRMALELTPDVTVVDIAMPLLNGLDAGEQLKQLLPSTKIVYLTMNTEAAVADSLCVRACCDRRMGTACRGSANHKSKS